MTTLAPILHRLTLILWTAAIAPLAPFDLKPQVLLMGIGRSGTTWTGNMLGHAGNARLLHEPITQSSLGAARERGGRGFLADDPVLYERWGDRAFHGLPWFSSNILRADPAPFVRKRRIVKEVDPLLLPELIRRYEPRVVYLVRHPAAVALSAGRLGLGPAYLEGNLLANENVMNGPLAPWRGFLESLTDPWEREGARQGAMTRVGLDALSTWPDSRLVTYEELCRDPVTKLIGLYRFCGLRYDGAVETRIRRATSGGDRSAPFTTRRDTSRMADAFRREITADRLARLARGYRAFDLPVYASDADWRL